jgi:Carboxypeptidase regulatory-like domain
MGRWGDCGDGSHARRDCGKGAAVNRSVLLLLALCIRVQAQSTEVSGLLTDPSGAAVPRARIAIVSEERGVRRSSVSNGEGWYTISLLSPGTYTLTVDAKGFRSITRTRLTLNGAQPARIDFALQIGEPAETVTVTGDAPPVNLENGTLATTVDSEFVQKLPINGRTFQALLTLAPGVVPTLPTEAGGFQVNGQRSTSNAITIDGVSANIASPFQAGSTFSFGGGNVLGTTPSGTTQSVASMEELREFTAQTSGYGAQFGGQSGAQVALVTRSGTNQFHGSLFEYFRNEKLDANDWFLNRQGQPRQELRENNMGGSLGGPVWKDHAFFFLSYESDPYRLPNVQNVVVPNATYRAKAAPALRPLLDPFPLPTRFDGALLGLTLGPDSGVFPNQVPEKGSTNAASFKWDENWSRRLTTFARYHRTPSQVSDSQITNLANTYTNTQTATAGATYVVSPRAVNELRVNYSRNSSGQQNPPTGQFGTVAPPDSALIAPGAGVTVSESSVLFEFDDADFAAVRYGRQAKFVMHQFEWNDQIHWTAGSHNLSFGGDWRRLFPSFDANPYILVMRILDGTTGSAAAGLSKGEAATLRMHSLGLFAADSWKASTRLHVDLGVRWEVLTPPSATDGPQPFAAQNFDANNPAAATFAAVGTPLWKTRYRNFAPRFGAAYQVAAHRGYETVVRGAFGLNYDLGLGILGALSSLAPFTRTGPSVTGVYPELLSRMTVPPVSTAKTGNSAAVELFDPNLKQPYTATWNFGVEQAIGASQSLSLDYVGNAGHRLLRVVTSLGGNAQGGVVSAESNQAFSNYDALQAQFRRRLGHGFQAIVNYTWSHAIDNSSSELVFGDVVPPGSVVPPRSQRSSSSFDVRHAFSAGATYDLVVRSRLGVARRMLSNWSINPLIRAYSGKPVDVIYTSTLFSAAGLQIFRLHPDFVAGAPVWLQDGAQPRHERINAAAFAVPTGSTPGEGNLGRNALRGFGWNQVDLSIHRTFALTERLRLRMGVDAFNLFNHPSFLNPSGSLGGFSFGRFTPDPTFGLSQAMLGRPGNVSLGAGGLSPMYAPGTQRDVQLGLRLGF